MAFKVNMKASARRHLEAADKLKSSNRGDVAGYLYGISAECAIKAMMIDLRIKEKKDRRDDPYYLHFPALKTTLQDKLQGRLAAPLIKVLSDRTFFANWSIEMRYSKGDEIKNTWIENWATQAKRTVSLIET